jgi:hypothetical protein
MSKNTELKNDIIRLILELDDLSFLQQLKKMVLVKSNEYSDWANELNESQIEMIKLGEEQIRSGQFVRSEDLHQESKAFFEKKRKEHK